MYKRLKGLMVEKSISQNDLARMLNVSVSTLNFKINGKSDFTISEGKKLKIIFEKSLDEIFEQKDIWEVLDIWKM